MKIRMLSLLLVLCIMLSGCSSATPVHAPGSGATDLDSEITQAESAPEQGADEPEQDPASQIVRSNVKFADMKYKRPNTTQLISDLNVLYDRYFEAATPEERSELVVEINRRVLDFMTMYALADIRNALDVTDTFYASELEVLGRARNSVTNASRAFYERLLQPENKALAEELLSDWEMEDLTLGVRAGSADTTALQDEEDALVLQYQEALAGIGAVYSIEEFCDRYYDDWSGLFLQLAALRDEQAALLGYDSFVELGYDRMGRTDYDAEDVEVFRAAVKRYLVPVYQQLLAESAEQNGFAQYPFYLLDALVPTPDVALEEEQTLATFREIYREMSPETAACVDYMFDNGLYDLEPAETKYPGGFQEYIYGYASPFLFGNFYGTADDVSLFSHEFGHFFAAFRKINPDPAQYRDADRTMDIREMQSSGMELLTMRWYERLFGDDATQFEAAGVVNLVTLILDCCMYDEWQHEVYARYDEISALDDPAAELDAILKRLRGEYYGELDYAHLEPYGEGRMWIEKSHLFETPFYMIDYALAYSVSLQMYNAARSDWDAGFAMYMAMMDCPAGSSFSEVVAAAGLQSPFEASTVQGLARLLKTVCGSSAVWKPARNQAEAA